MKTTNQKIKNLNKRFLESNLDLDEYRILLNEIIDTEIKSRVSNEL